MFVERTLDGRSGSSPRVRGTRGQRVLAARQARFIPACAGNSSSLSRSSATSPVHPRVCGELSRMKSQTALRIGSSPRVRGTRRSSRGRTSIGRFIPACAGNSCSLSVSATPLIGSSPRVRGTPASRLKIGAPGAVHPRVCGELLPVRGGHVRRRRFIPACAGNSNHGHQDHHPLHGSSPRVRGTRHGADEFLEVGRFIPACAGNSSRTKPWQMVSDGSSPRVRGTPRATIDGRTHWRFIPACAGNSKTTARSCTAATGSSPRVRGTLP